VSNRETSDVAQGSSELPQVRIRDVGESPSCSLCSDSYLILRHAHTTAEGMLESYELVREGRRSEGKIRGALTDHEQDLFRAMLVFACAGLDSMLKQLIQDALPMIAQRDGKARQELQKFVARKLGRASGDDLPVQLDTSFLTSLLIAESPQSACADALVQELTGRSLQSLQEVRRVVAHLALDWQSIVNDEDSVIDALQARNQITHEMDIDLAAPRRNRFQRKVRATIAMSNSVLQLAEKILVLVDGKLGELDQAHSGSTS